ncbi:hypothetical protein JD844_013711 [Phrynosoma platyrhinos]|uniref:SCAN box domain-containing protein n=1 Tax=Phrynosoma platyrhinos TaxID=52577 RepID=A0ABQ7TL49_PHRPL|nr:hypothetical protein JD844_013711 [Phrynosoma platyrhinos]
MASVQETRTTDLLDPEIKMEEEDSVGPEVEEVIEGTADSKMGRSGGGEGQTVKEEPEEEPPSNWDAQLEEFLRALQSPHLTGKTLQQIDPNRPQVLPQGVTKANKWPRGLWVSSNQPPLIEGATEGDESHWDATHTGKGKEGIPRKDAVGLEMQRQHFRTLSYQEADGPRNFCRELQELCRNWLVPERHTKEQMLELVTLEQFLAVLPLDMQKWLKEHAPESCAQAVTLAEDFLLRQQRAGGWEGQISKAEFVNPPKAKEAKPNMTKMECLTETEHKHNGDEKLITAEEQKLLLQSTEEMEELMTSMKTGKQNNFLCQGEPDENRQRTDKHKGNDQEKFSPITRGSKRVKSTELSLLEGVSVERKDAQLVSASFPPSLSCYISFLSLDQETSAEVLQVAKRIAMQAEEESPKGHQVSLKEVTEPSGQDLSQALSGLTRDDHKADETSRDFLVKVKEEIPDEDAVSLEERRQRFRKFCYREADGPRNELEPFEEVIVNSPKMEQDPPDVEEMHLSMDIIQGDQIPRESLPKGPQMDQVSGVQNGCKGCRKKRDPRAQGMKMEEHNPEKPGERLEGAEPFCFVTPIATIQSLHPGPTPEVIWASGNGLKQHWVAPWQAFLKTMQYPHFGQRNPPLMAPIQWSQAEALQYSFKGLAHDSRWPRRHWMAPNLPGFNTEGQLEAKENNNSSSKVKEEVPEDDTDAESLGMPCAWQATKNVQANLQLDERLEQTELNGMSQDDGAKEINFQELIIRETFQNQQRQESPVELHPMLAASVGDDHSLAGAASCARETEGSDCGAKLLSGLM